MKSTIATDINVAIELLNELIETDYNIELSQACYVLVEILKENLKSEGEPLVYEKKNRKQIIEKTIQMVKLTASIDKDKYPGIEKLAKIITDELYNILDGNSYVRR